MKGALFLAFAKLKGGGRVLAAARHNKRELQHERGATSHIDAQRSTLNYCLAGNITANGIDEAAKQAIAATGTTLRKDAVRVIEAVFSLPRNSTIEHRRYFTDCTRWIGERFGAANILSSDVHLDEAAPHCHVLFLPLVDGRMRGSELLGGRARLAELANDFHANVATLYGLPRRAPKLVGERKRELAKIVIERLLSVSDPATRSATWQSIRESIESDPEPFASQLSIEALKTEKQPKQKSFAATMIGRGKRTSEDMKPIGFAKRPKTTNPILCRVRNPDDGVSSPNLPTERDAEEPKEPFGESTRLRESEISVDQFNTETGEFVTTRVRNESVRDQALEKIRAALRSTRRVAASPNRANQ